MCTYKSCQIGSSWMKLQVQRNSPSAFHSPSPLFSVELGWQCVQHWRGGRGWRRRVEKEGRDCKGNKLESLAVKFLEAWHYTHWLITMFTYHTSLPSLKLCTAYNHRERTQKELQLWHFKGEYVRLRADKTCGFTTTTRLQHSLGPGCECFFPKQDCRYRNFNQSACSWRQRHLA